MTDALGDQLIAGGVIDAAQVGKAEAHSRHKDISLARAVVECGFARDVDVWRPWAKVHKMPFVDLEDDLAKGGRIRAAVLDLVPSDVVTEHRVVPVTLKGETLVLAVDDPVATYHLDTLRFVLGREIVAALATPTGIARAMAHYYDVAGSVDEADVTLPTDDEGDDAPIIRLVARMIRDAVDQSASDIHVEPMEDRVRVRFRKDGVLVEVASHEVHLLGPMTSRLKIMASMDIAEKRKPQDGRINVQVAGRPIDIRASVLPSNHGETIVMRLLDKERGLVSLPELGFHIHDLERFRGAIDRPNGIVLVTGPTGSGKTTTLYAALSELNRPDVKIITAEDPVEYEIHGINQVQVHGKIGLSFARILRAMLRQAPNVILVGEIRDHETAEVAIQAALTGHLVFATLHTNDAPSALARLADMGVKPFLVSASVQAVVAQRLVRKLCRSCAVVYDPEPSELAAVGLEAERVAGRTIKRAEGCSDCGFTGYAGRVAVYEMLSMDSELRDMTFRNEPTMTIRAQGERSGKLTTMRADGLRKVLDGVTSISELLRVVHAADAQPAAGDVA